MLTPRGDDITGQLGVTIALALGVTISPAHWGDDIIRVDDVVGLVGVTILLILTG